MRKSFSIQLILLIFMFVLWKRSHNMPQHSEHEGLTGKHRLSPEIVHELSDFLSLVPTATLDELVAKYYITDGGFRAALSFMRSSEFNALLDSSLDIPEVLGVLDYIHLLQPTMTQSSAADDARWLANSVIDVQPKANLSDREPDNNVVFEFVLLESIMLKEIIRADAVEESSTGVQSILSSKEAMPQQRRHPAPLASQPLHSFTSFVNELLQHLPHDAFVRMIQEKRTRNRAFAEFYKELRGQVLPLMVDYALASKNVQPVVKTLAAHSINAKELRDVAFKVISWGPVV